MKISYSVNGKYLLKSLCLPMSEGCAYLVTGVENTGYTLLGGLIAKLFPISESLREWPQMQALITNYSGELTVEEGALPETTAYVGVDPDRHFVFSRVEEEFISQGIDSSKSLKNLFKFGLNEYFLERRIPTLSGGEKMRVALSIAFAKRYSCYVLHGVIPWLDKRGRELLIEQIQKAKRKGSTVILLEHEASSLFGIVNKVFKFDGITANELNINDYFTLTHKDIALEGIVGTLTRNFTLGKIETKTLEFKKVSLLNYPDSERSRTNPLLNKISFSLTEQNIYFLVGYNGAGKSTVAQIAFNIIKPDSGEIYFSGKPIKSYSRAELINLICYVGQHPEHQITFNTFGQYKKEAEAKNNTLALELMDEYLQLPEQFPVSLFSPLQKKLICLFSFISTNTKLIILDEPTWGIDRYDQKKIVKVLKKISDQVNFSLFIISHDIAFASFFKPTILWICDGELKEFSNYEKFQSDDRIRRCFALPGDFDVRN